MRISHKLLQCVAVLIVIAGVLTPAAVAQTVNITMVCNTSTCLDTLRPTHFVQLLGESKRTTTPAMSWTPGSGVAMVNIGGDYWRGTFQAQVGDTILFKFWTGFTTTTGTFHWTGWEGPIFVGGLSTNNNRAYIVANKDTTLPLQYFNGWEGQVGQYWRPFEPKADSVAVYFRVNMGSAAFNPATQLVDARGGLPMGADPAWITIKTLSREPNSVNSGSFWSGVAYIAKSAITAGTTTQLFKWVIQPNTWESAANRSFVFRGTNDTTINWTYYNNLAPSGPRVNADVLWILKLDALEKVGLFNRALGDKVAVTGAKGWPPDPFTFETEPAMLKMIYDPGAREWNLVEAFSLFENEAITYKYFISWDTTRVTPAHANYIPGLQMTNGWEEPGVTGGADRRYVYTSSASQTIAGDFGADQQYFNSLHWKGAIAHPIRVTFNINMAPAALAAENPGVLFRPGIDTAFIQYDGSFNPVTKGLTMWGADNRLMLTDENGDGIYSATDTLTKPSLYQFCYRIVYTSPSGEIWNGSGSAIRGRRYYQYVHPTSVKADSAVWPTTYTLATMPWMLDSLTIEDPPNLDQVTVGVSEEGDGTPGSYTLRQNYPNPFNPSTVITYDLPMHGRVKIDVHNILGQRLVTLVDQEMDAGTHSVAWNAQLSRAGSGVYIVRMQSGSFTAVRRMILAK